MRNEKYDPARKGWHKSVVDNIRATAKEQKLHTDKYTDEELFKLWQECYFTEDCDTSMMDDIRTKQ